MSKAQFEGTCGVCERTFMVHAQTMVRHGYTRPGDGYIHGRCFGEKMFPWEISSEPASEFLKLVLRPRHETLTANLALFTAGHVTSLSRRKQQLLSAKRRGDSPEYETLTPGHIDWPRALAGARMEVAAELSFYTTKIRHFEERIAAWTPGKLKPVAPAPTLPFTPVYPSVVVSREVRRGGFRRQTYSSEVWTQQGWVKTPWAMLEPLYNASPRLARPMTEGERLAGRPVDGVFDPYTGKDVVTVAPLTAARQ